MLVRRISEQRIVNMNWVENKTPDLARLSGVHVFLEGTSQLGTELWPLGINEFPMKVSICSVQSCRALVADAEPFRNRHWLSSIQDPVRPTRKPDPDMLLSRAELHVDLPSNPGLVLVRRVERALLPCCARRVSY